ncbi:ABC transporter family substrate-binding protein [Leucobacter albus]|uniref:ABC transporter family substrate-binding protein n=1 Tax=Leucobacter albus TaxID=272210 RepID=A0ABW3TQI6_9MICO
MSTIRAPRPRRRVSAISAAAVGLAVTISACAPMSPTGGGADPAPVAEVTDGGTITMAATSPIEDWNPLSAAGDTTGQRQQQWPMYPHTFLSQPDTSIVLNEALLASAEVTKTDPMTVVYEIQDEAVWSDGTPITADDFIYTQAVQDPDSCGDCMAAFTAGYDSIESITGSEDGKTVTMVYREPFSQWRALFNYILPSHVATKYGDLATSFNEGFSRNVPEVSGGPYQVKEYTEGISLTLEKNPKWYGDPAHLDEVIIRYIKGQGEQVTALQSGEVQMVYINPTVDTVEQVKSMAQMTYSIGPTLTYAHLGMKTTGDVMSDKALRQAIYTAMNFQDMYARTAGQAAPDVPLMQSAVYVPGQKVEGIDAYRPNTEKVGMGTGDVAAATAILEDAGYTIVDGKLMLPDGSPLRDLTFLTYSADQTRMDLALIAQQQLKEIGVTIVIDPADAARYSPALREGAFDIMATGTALDLGPLSLQQWYGTGAARSFGYSNPEVDELLAQAGAELDPERHVELMNDLDERLLEDGVVMPLFAYSNMAAYDAKYRNIYVDPSKYGVTMNIEQWGIAG